VFPYSVYIQGVCVYIYIYMLDNVKIGNLKKSIGIIKIPKQDEDAGNLQILLHLKSLFRVFDCMA